MQVGVDTWSYHRELDPLPGEGPRTTLEAILPRLVEAGTEIVSLSAGLGAYDSPDGRRRLRGILETLNIPAQLNAGAISPRGASLPAVAEQVLPALDLAAYLGVTVCRVVTGWFREPATDAAAEAARTIAALEYFEPLARARGIHLAIENHADFRRAELLAILNAIPSDWVGITFDPQNCAKIGDDPFIVAEAFLPRILTTHVRDSRVESLYEPGRDARYGIRIVNCRLGEGLVPLREILSMLAALRADVPWIIESIPGSGDEHEAVVADLVWLRRLRSELAPTV
jgi:sugar phosphate isomerase/epimerase